MVDGADGHAIPPLEGGGGSKALIDGAGPVSLGLIDWIVVAAYLGGLVAFGLTASRLATGPEDYFLASRGSNWLTIGLALLASNMSSAALVGLAGGAYANGISVYDYEWTAVGLLVFFAVFMLPFILGARVYTMPEYLERRYDGRARLCLALLTLFLCIFIDAAGGLYSGALICRIVLPSAPLWLIAAALASAAALYTVAGGLRAVIRTQAIHAAMLFAGAVAIAVTAFVAAGGWHHVMAATDPDRLSLIRPAGDPAMPWPGLVSGVPILGFYYWCTNQFMIQRVLSAHDLDHGRWGVLLMGFLKLPILYLMVLPGICAGLLFPGLPKADLVYPALVFTLLPAGLAGAVIAAFAGATMATVASMLSTASTLITVDIIGPRLARNDARLVTFGRLAALVVLAAAVAWVPVIERMPSLWQYLQAVLAYAVPPVVALFLVGMTWRGATADGAAAAFVLGAVAGFGLFLANVVLGWTHLHFLYVAPILLAFDVAVLVAVSVATAGKPAKPVDGLLWTPAFYRAESLRLAGLPLWRNYRILSALLLAATGVLVWSFR